MFNRNCSENSPAVPLLQKADGSDSLSFVKTLLSQAPALLDLMLPMIMLPQSLLVPIGAVALDASGFSGSLLAAPHAALFGGVTRLLAADPFSDPVWGVAAQAGASADELSPMMTGEPAALVGTAPLVLSRSASARARAAGLRPPPPPLSLPPTPHSTCATSSPQASPATPSAWWRSQFGTRRFSRVCRSRCAYNK